jgi:RND family efflux transporter MFP subunit
MTMNSPVAAGPGRRRNRRTLLIGVAALAVLGAGLAIFWPRPAPQAKAAAPVAAMVVTAARAAPAAWPDTLAASGAIAPWQEAIIGAQVSGLRLSEVRVNVGDTVRRGQVLARFDTAMLQAEAAQLNAGLAQARASLAQADADRQRADQLKGSGGISEQEILRYVTQADTARAQAQAARAQLDAKRLQLRYGEVLAPDDGVISARDATLGAVAGNGQELFRLIRQGRLEWRGELTAGQLRQVAPGQRIDLALPDGGTAGARVRQTAPSLDATSRLGLVYADLDRGGGARAGMYAQGSVTLAQTQALVVPAPSVVIRDGRSYVFRLPANQDAAKVEARAVQVGRRRQAGVEIVSGLRDGDTVVVEGAGFINDGDLVKVVPMPAMRRTGR